ncbi:Cytochrome-c peroxidase [Niastella koreensis GR20-10]|uniref:Cytochrome-c peroxidase n=2 Tax=Niastella koreensis TaxID=354356 RepID=G8TEK5_NIAKG|nr:Cytochrome-c peroxidase [Niastella koreensis GR20-10]
MIVWSFCLAMAAGFTRSKPDIGVPVALAYFKTNAEVFASATGELQQSIDKLDDDPASVIKARLALKNTRLQYKKIAFFLEYFFKSAALIYNSAPKYEIEEPYMEYREPTGFQVIESLLYEAHPATKKLELLQQADVVTSSAKDLNALLYGFTANDKQLLESIQLELVRVITLSITGFDAPLLKTGIAESEMSLRALQTVLQPFREKATKTGVEVANYLSGGIAWLHQHPDFDSFDRLHFLTNYALPLQRSLQVFIKELQLQLNTTHVLNYEAGDLFNPAFLNLIAFLGADSSAQWQIGLGRRLFFDPGLSGNNKISCATCHQPEKHFTDGLTTSNAFDGHSHVPRNAPSLFYSAFQYRQFWDGKAESLQSQVKTVLFNVQEMNADSLALVKHLQQDTTYSKLMGAASPIDQIARCIAAYVRSLNPRSSRFDDYIQGKGPALSEDEIKGFNLFMGQAQCGTCHFAPLFNGLTPPLYDRTEFEVPGITRTDDLLHPVADTDMGRYPLFPMDYYKQAFKTPTVRNTAATAPYMHNGAFKTLEAVIEFYNQGGAAGLKLPIPNQTLSPLPLHLTPNEAASIVSFIHTLDDAEPTGLFIKKSNQ